MYEGGCDQNTGSEVSREENGFVRYREARIAAGNDGKGAC